MTPDQKIDEMYKMMIAREARDAVYRERVDNHLKNHDRAAKFLMWVFGSSSAGLVLSVIF